MLESSKMDRECRVCSHNVCAQFICIPLIFSKVKRKCTLICFAIQVNPQAQSHDCFMQASVVPTCADASTFPFSPPMGKHTHSALLYSPSWNVFCVGGVQGCSSPSSVGSVMPALPVRLCLRHVTEPILNLFWWSRLCNKLFSSDGQYRYSKFKTTGVDT